MPKYYVTETVTRIFLIEEDSADDAKMAIGWNDSFYASSSLEVEEAPEEEEVEDEEEEEEEEEEADEDAEW